MKNSINTENSLKRFLKKSKQISYSLGILVAFLINGELSFPLETIQKITKKLENNHSWQLGINYFWNKTHHKENKYNFSKFSLRKSNTDSFERSISKNSFSTYQRYWATTLKLEEEKKTRLGLELDIKLDVESKLPKEKSIKIKDKDLPVFYPRLVVDPIIREKDIQISETPQSPATDVAYQEIPNNITGYASEGTDKDGVTRKISINGGLISQLQLTKGNFHLYFKGIPDKYSSEDISIYNLGYDYRIEEVEANNTHEISRDTIRVGEVPLLPTNEEGTINAEAFYRHGGRKETTIGEDVNIFVVGNVEEGNALNSIFYLGNNTQDSNTESKLISKAKISLYGNKIVVANIDNVYSAGNITFVNEGKITGYAEEGMFSENKIGKKARNHIFGAYSYGDKGIDTIENSSKGSIKFYAPESVAWAYTSAQNQNVERRSINNGIVQLFGKNSIGVATDRDVSSEQMRYANIQLNNPIEIYGDSSVGINILTSPSDIPPEPNLNNINAMESPNYFRKSIFNVELGGENFTVQKESGNKENGDIKSVDNSIGLNFDYLNSFKEKSSDEEILDEKIVDEGVVVNNITNKKIVKNMLRDSSILQEEEIKKYRVVLNKNSRDSIGVRAGFANIKLVDQDAFSYLEVGGEKNIGVLSEGKFPNPTFTSTIEKRYMGYKQDENGNYIDKNGNIIKNLNGEYIDSSGNIITDIDSELAREYDNRLVRIFEITNTETEEKLVESGENSSSITYENTRNAYSLGGKDNILLAAQDGGKINIENSLLLNEKEEAERNTLVYSSGENSLIHLKKSLKGELKGIEDIVFFASNGGEIKSEDILKQNLNIQNGILDSVNLEKEKIRLTGKNASYIYSKNSKILSDNSHVRLDNGLVGIVSEGSNSKVNFKNSILDYSGNGYAIYSRDNGKIDMTDSTVILRGNSVGFQTTTLSNIKTDGMKIVMMSDNAIPFEVKNKDILNISTLEQDLNLENYEIIVGKEGDKKYSNYKKAYIDGVNELNIDVDIDKAIAANDTVSTNSSSKFIKKYLFQRSKTNLKSGKIISSILDQEQLSKLGETSVVGIVANASANATTNTDSHLILETGSKIISDRLDKGEAAVGIYGNYSKLKLEKGSKLEVENGNNTKNNGAIGIFASNSSIVENEGEVLVGGNKSIGIIAEAWRRNKNQEKQVNEFGEQAKEQGNIFIFNKSKIYLNGESTRGILANNNNNESFTDKHLVENEGNIVLEGRDSVGIDGVGVSVLNKGTIELKSKNSNGIYTKGLSKVINETDGNIILGNSEEGFENIGIYSQNNDTEVLHKGKIIGKDYSYGIYGGNITTDGTIKVGDVGFGIYSTAKKILLEEHSKTQVGKNSIAILNNKDNAYIQNNSNNILIDENSYVFVLKGKNSTYKSEVGTNIILPKGSTYLYAEEASITNNTNLTSTGDKIFGIYSSGIVENRGTIDFSSRRESVGIFSDKGVVKNFAPIKVGRTEGNEYSIGLSTKNGTIYNNSDIILESEGGVGLYGSGKNAKIINTGNIYLSGKDTIGMFLTNGAIGENYGEIRTTVNPGKGIVGVLALDGSLIKNYGKIIVEGDTNKGIIVENSKVEEETGKIEVTNGAERIKNRGYVATTKTFGDINILSNQPDEKAVIKNLKTEEVIIPEYVDTVSPIPDIRKVKTMYKGEESIVSIDSLKFDTYRNEGKVSELGMYVDTSGINFTTPIEGIDKVRNLGKVNLVFGVEATKYSNKKVIVVGDNILAPYNKVIKLSNKNKELEWNMQSNSLSWAATAVQDSSNNNIKYVYLTKKPYSSFATDKSTYNFGLGLDERYDVAELNSEEKDIFNKLNSLGKTEGKILAQAFDEIKGHSYANLNRRIKYSKDIYDKEFDSLLKWDTKTFSTTKIKLFGDNTKYNSNKVGLRSYDYNTRGVYSVHEKNMGNKLNGWFAGISEEKFTFKDIGRSQEKTITSQFGYHSTKFWGEESSNKYFLKLGLDASHRKMKRNYFILDDIYSTNAKYYSVSLFLDQKYSKEYNVSSSFKVEPMIGLNLSYGKISSIKEQGPLALESSSKIIYTIKPKTGFILNKKYTLEQGYVSGSFSFELSKDLAYQYDSAKKIKLKGTKADPYSLKKDKESISSKISISLNLEKINYGIGIKTDYNLKQKRSSFGIEAHYKF